MKVLHITRYDCGGGADIAAVRLHRGLLKYGLDSNFLVSRQLSNENNTNQIAMGCRFTINRIQNAVVNGIGCFRKEPDSYGCSINIGNNGILKRIEQISPDIVHLHWVGANVMRIEDLPRITQPVVWTMHDMWPFCGAEHCDLSSGKRRNNGYIKSNRSTSASGLDLNRWVWQRKWNCWDNKYLTLVGPSKWISDYAAESRLFGKGRPCSHQVIPNGIDLEIFKPLPKKEMKVQLGMDPNRIWILFGAASLTNPIKGADKLAKAVKCLESEGFMVGCAVFGKGDLKISPGIAVLNFHNVQSDVRLSEIYSAADVTVVPSLIDNLPNIVIESFACGTPVVCFDKYGLSEMVSHKNNGYKAYPGDANDLANGIRWCLANDTRHRSLCEQSRNTAIESYSIEKCCTEYIQVYRRMITRNRKIMYAAG